MNNVSPGFDKVTLSSKSEPSKSTVHRANLERAAQLLSEQRRKIYCRTDRLFVGLLIFQWLAAVAISLIVSPRTWSGDQSQIHIHVWLALLLGGTLTLFPVCLALWRPGHASTRHCIGAGQMLMSALLIHLTGGRIETHFHVFGSLAFLAFYRDWKVLISASIIVAADHFLRGVYYPESVYGIASSESWRWLEHTGWVVFEDIFLILAGRQSILEMQNVADRQAQLEITQEQIEATVRERTEELNARTKILQEKTSDLIRTNEELEQFAYVASHDLKEPLRNIACFSQLLAMRYEDRIDSEADEFIHYITTGVRRMDGLINDLLTYSRIGKSNVTASINCEKVLMDVIEDLRTIIEETSAVITNDPLPVLKGDEREWRQLFQNIIGNALKFRGERPPRIHVSVEEREVPRKGDHGNSEAEKSWVFSIKDNGIGLAPQFAERIFVIFQRLHSQSQYPGTGIGLAICKKIIEQHRGRIWVESKSGEGCNFLFSIPCQNHFQNTDRRLNGELRPASVYC